MKKNKNTIEPVWFPEVTEILKGSEKEKAIPVHIDGKYNVTKWKISWLQRFKSLFNGGFIYITIQANEMPLMTVTTETPIN